MILGSTKPESRFTPSTDECPTPELWSCYDDAATEVEVLEFLYSLVRLTKPQIILETGTYHGHGTVHLAQAAKDNGFGRVITCDCGRDEIEVAKARIYSYGLGNLVEFNCCTGFELISRVKDVDFAFLDSASGTCRAEELRQLLPKLSRQAVVAVHDTSTIHQNCNGGPRNGLKEIASEFGLQIILFDTPRGLTLLRR